MIASIKYGRIQDQMMSDSRQQIVEQIFSIMGQNINQTIEA